MIEYYSLVIPLRGNRKCNKSSLFVLSSVFEGMPNALMEAMAMGVPSISTDCEGGGARFLIKNKKNGILVPIGDLEALVSAMDKVLSDQTFAESIGLEAHNICNVLAPNIIYGQWEKYDEEYCKLHEIGN